MTPDWLRFQVRRFPSANLVGVASGDGLLVDTGFGSDIQLTHDLVTASGLTPDAPGFQVVNTHWHSDHVGGNASFQARHRVRIAAGAAEGERVNAGDPDAFGAAFLGQPVDAYRVDRLLRIGEVVEAGHVGLEVIDLAGHSAGQIGLFEPRARVLLGGDALLARDVAWINPFLDGGDAVARAIATMERIRDLRPALVVPGHGPLLEDVEPVVSRSLDRLRAWSADSSLLAWHGPPRVFAFALMIRRGIPREQVIPYLLGRRWLRDFATLAGLTPTAYADALLERMLQAGGVRWSATDRLVAATPHTPPPEGWEPASGWP